METGGSNSPSGEPCSEYLQAQRLLVNLLSTPSGSPSLGGEGKIGGSPNPPSIRLRRTAPLYSPCIMPSVSGFLSFGRRKEKLGDTSILPQKDWQRVNPLCQSSVQKHPLGRAILSPNPMQTKRPLFHKERPLKISGGDGGESNSPSRRALFRVSTSLYGCLFSLRCHPPPDFSGASRCFLGDPYRHRDRCTSTFRRPIPNPSRRGRGGRSCLFRQLGRIVFRQLLFLPSVLRVR